MKETFVNLPVKLINAKALMSSDCSVEVRNPLLLPDSCLLLAKVGYMKSAF